jgi:sulfite exporter TauE/SafE
LNASLITAGLLLGLASSPHCALMCSAPCAAIVRGCSAAPAGRGTAALLAWHGGRALAYVVAGAIAASAVGLVAGLAAGSAIVRPLWTMMQSAVLVLGLALAWSGRMPRWVDGAAQTLGRAVPVAGPHRAGSPSAAAGPRRAALFGLGWFAMPCAVLYGALAVAALGAGPLEGAAVMAAFALGSAPGLIGLPFVWQGLSRVPQSTALRLAGAMLAAGSLWALWHGIAGASGAWCLTA